MNILIVEDEVSLSDIISSRLKEEGYNVDVSLTGDEGNYMALTGIYDLIILDIMLPFIDGFTILKNLRDNSINSKVIMMSARGEIEDKIEGFSKGAEDYITKPFHIEELVMRVNVQLKKNNSNIISYGNLQLDKSLMQIKNINNDISVSVVKKEFLLLELFINNPDKVLSKEQIYDKVWGMDNDIQSNNLEAYLSFIRRKLTAISSDVSIKAVRGIGYRMVKNLEKSKS